MQLTNTKFYVEDPESQDALDQDDGLNGGSEAESGSNFWIYALIGVLVLAGLIVLLIVCIRHNPQLTAKDTQRFAKRFCDDSQKNSAAAAAVKAKLGKTTTPEDEIKLLDDFEQIIKDQLKVVKDAEPVADRINKDTKFEINGVKSVQETVKTFLNLIKEAAEAAKAVVETQREQIKAAAVVKAATDAKATPPKVPTAEQLKAVTDLAAKLKTEEAEAATKLQALTPAAPEIQKLFPTKESHPELFKDKDAKPAKTD